MWLDPASPKNGEILHGRIVSPKSSPWGWLFLAIVMVLVVVTILITEARKEGIHYGEKKSELQSGINLP